MWIVVDGFAELSQSDKNAYTIAVEMRTCFERRSITIGSFQIAVILLFPLVYLIELCGNSVLQNSGFGLPIDLFVNLIVD